MSGLKMAKASEADMELADGVASILDSLGRGYYPAVEDKETEDAARAGDLPTFFDPDNKAHLRHLYDMLMKLDAKGSMFRVSFGYRVLMDNRVVDPAQSTLQFHPTLTAAAFARDPGAGREEVVNTIIDALVKHDRSKSRWQCRRTALAVLVAMGIIAEGAS